MIADLRNNPAKMDRAEGGKYDHTKAIHIVTPYTFGTYDGSTMLFSDTFSEAEPLTPVRIYSGVDYAAYFQTRNAKGTYTPDSAAWTISDENLRIVQSRIGTTTVPGEYKAEGLTVKVGDVAYEIKSITYDGLSRTSSAVRSVSMTIPVIRARPLMSSTSIFPTPISASQCPITM